MLRLPGSLVTVLAFTAPSMINQAWVGWLQVLQVFCDPLQVYDDDENSNGRCRVLLQCGWVRAGGGDGGGDGGDGAEFGDG